MDPFSIAAGSASLLQCIIQTVNCIAIFIRAAHHAKEELEYFSKRLCTLQAIVSLMEQDNKNSTKHMPEDQTEMMVIINDCFELMQDAKNIIADQSGRLGSFNWALRGQKEFAALNIKLDACIQQLDLLMSRNNCHLLQVMQLETEVNTSRWDEIQRGVQTILETTNNLQAKSTDQMTSLRQLIGQVSRMEYGRYQVNPHCLQPNDKVEVENGLDEMHIIEGVQTSVDVLGHEACFGSHERGPGVESLDQYQSTFDDQTTMTLVEEFPPETGCFEYTEYWLPENVQTIIDLPIGPSTPVHVTLKMQKRSEFQKRVWDEAKKTKVSQTAKVNKADEIKENLRAQVHNAARTCSQQKDTPGMKKSNRSNESIRSEFRRAVLERKFALL